MAVSHQPLTTGPAVPPAARPEAHDWLSVLFFICLALSLIPLFVFPYVPDGDGPVHFYGANLLKEILTGKGDYVSWLLEFNPVPVPNWLSHALLALLSVVFTPFTADRILLAAYVVGLPLAFRYVVRSISRDNSGCEFLIFPVVFNSHLHWGFYNFVLSLVIYLTVLGYWVRHRDGTGFRVIPLAVLAVILNFAHPVSMTECVIAIAVLSAWEILRQRQLIAVQRAAWHLAALVPALALYEYFFTHRVHLYDAVVRWTTTVNAASNLVKLTPLKSFYRSELFSFIPFTLCVAVAALVAAWRIIRGKGQPELAGFALLAAVQTATVFFAPTTFGGGGMITPRLVYYAVFSIIAALSTVCWSKTWRRAFVTTGICTAVGLTILHWPAYQAYSARMDALIRSVPPLRAGTTIVFLTSEDTTPLMVTNGVPHISASAGAYIAVRDHLIYLNDFQPSTDHFPFLYRPEANPFGNLIIDPPFRFGQKRGNETLNPSAYLRKTGVALDYILLWGWDAHTNRESLDGAIGLTRSGDRYEEVAISDNGLPLRLLRRMSEAGS